MPNYKIIISIFLGLAACTAIILYISKAQPRQPKINSFSDCIQAGYPVRNDYFPRQCTTPNGKIFVEEKIIEQR